MNKKAQEGTLMFGAMILIIAIVSLVFSVYSVPAGHRGVMTTFGKVHMEAIDEGIHLKLPWARVRDIEVRTVKLEVDADSVSKDLQDVQTTIALNYHLSPSETPKLYQEIGSSYEDRVIAPAIQEGVKASMAQFKAEELTQRRPEVRMKIQDNLRERLGKYYIIIDDFNVVNFQFSEEFDKAIEEKVTAEQKKLKAERDLERIKVEAEQIKTEAEAEAFALLEKSKAVRDNPDIVNLKQMEVRLKEVQVAEKAVDKWNGQLPQVTGGALPFLSLGELQNVETSTESTGN